MFTLYRKHNQLSGTGELDGMKKYKSLINKVSVHHIQGLQIT
jgi:hypothetical protein